MMHARSSGSAVVRLLSFLTKATVAAVRIWFRRGLRTKCMHSVLAATLLFSVYCGTAPAVPRTSSRSVLVVKSLKMGLSCGWACCIGCTIAVVCLLLHCQL